MPMNMLGVMYATSDRLTLSEMMGVTSMGMDHITATGVEFTTNASSVSDLKISGLYKIFNKNKPQLHVKGDISLPTGSIDEKDVTPASGGVDVILLYPMQIGSGTVDALLGGAYLW